MADSDQTDITPQVDNDAPPLAATDSLDDLIARYAGGPPPDEDYVDPELASLSTRPPVLQLLLILVVMFFGAFVGFVLKSELLYYFADSTPVDLGPAEDLAVTLEEDPDYLRQFGNNVYASVSGVPSRRSVAGEQQFSQLVGGPIFVESEREDADVDPLLRDVRPRIGPHDTGRTRFYIETTGRLLAISELGTRISLFGQELVLSNRHSGFIDFYRDGYDIWFCGADLTPRQADFRRLTARELADELGREPTEEELDEAYPCTYGVVVQANRAPEDNLGYLIVFIFIGLVELAGAAYVIRWLTQFRAASRSAS